MSEKYCRGCFSLGQQLEMAQQEIKRLQYTIVQVEKDHREDVAWNDLGETLREMGEETEP